MAVHTTLLGDWFCKEIKSQWKMGWKSAIKPEGFSNFDSMAGGSAGLGPMRRRRKIFLLVAPLGISRDADASCKVALPRAMETADI